VLHCKCLNCNPALSAGAASFKCAIPVWHTFDHNGCTHLMLLLLVLLLLQPMWFPKASSPA
jgi:hypothetical protein